MQPTESQVLTTSQIASMLELRPTRADLDEAEVLRLCAEAQRLAVGAVTIAPSDLDSAARFLGDGRVTLSTIIDPLGNATTAVKQYAARDALRRGARRIETALNRAKMNSRHFQYVESELRQLVEACREKDATLVVSLSPWTDNSEEMDILTARVARRTGVDALCTTHFDHARRLLELSRETYAVALQHADAALEDVLQAREAGCTRVCLSNAAVILQQHAALNTASAPPTPAS